MSSYRPRTLPEYLQVIWSRKWLLFLIVAVMLISTFVVINRIPDQYQSTASVVVAGNQEDRQAVSARVATVTERINSRSFLEPLIARYGLYSKQVAAGAIDAAVSGMRRDIKVDTKYRNEMPETVSVTYRNPDPEIARTVATDLASTFARMNDAVERQTEERASQISSELSQIEDRLKQLGEQRAIASARSRAAAGSHNMVESVRSQRTAAQSSLETLSDKQYALEQQIAEQKRQIADQEKIARTSPSDLRSGGSYGVLLVRKAELEGQLKDYQTQYTDKNPKVTQTRTQLGEIDHQLTQLTAAAGEGGVPVNSPEARELRSMQRDLSRLNTELEVTKREVARKQESLNGPAAQGPGRTSAPSVAAAPASDVVGETDKDRLRSRYEALLRQQDDLARTRTMTAGLDPGLFQIIDLPAESRLPAGPDRWRLRLVAIALAIGVGLIVVAAVEAPRLFTIRDDRDVRYYLGTRVVALIPETLTPGERGRVRKVLIARAVGLLLLGAILVPLLVVAFDKLRIFQLMANRW